MRVVVWSIRAWSAVAVGGCIEIAGDEVETGEARALISATSAIPPDGACVHVVTTRLSDFAVREYRGPLAGGAFSVDAGDNRVTATAYAAPCSSEPAQAPWIAEDQIVTFTGGSNTLVLPFHRNSGVTIDPSFDDETTTLVQAGSYLRTAGAYEDAAAPFFALDGWDVRGIALPPSSPSNPVVCHLTGLPYSPRGLAVAGSRFIVQLSETDRPLYVFDGCALVETWPVDYAAGQVVWTNTDGLEAIDATHFVRTGWAAEPQHCETDCYQGGIELLQLVSGRLSVTRQIPLPAPYRLQYPVGVTPIGNNFAVTTVDGNTSELFLIDSFGNLMSSGTPVPGDAEGLFDAGTGRIGLLDIRGNLKLMSATDGSSLGIGADYRQGPDFFAPTAMTWLPAPRNQLVMLSGQEHRWMTVSADFSAPAFAVSDYDNPSGLAYKANTDELLITNRLPPIDTATNTRIPTVDVRSASSRSLVSSIKLRDLPLPVRSLSLAYITQGQLIATHYTRPGAVPDVTLDPVVYIHDLSGALVRSFSLQPYGFTDIWTVDYLPASNELVIGAVDFTGKRRLVVTTTTGQPSRSYRADELDGPLDLAPMIDGPFVGDIGVLQDTGSYVRIRLP